MKKKSPVFVPSLVAIGISLCWINVSMAQSPFDHMDGNSDGLLTRFEFKGPRPAFSRLDSNRDGFISLKEAAGTRLTRRKNGPSTIVQTSPEKRGGPPVYVDTHNHLVGRRVMGRLELGKPARIALQTMDDTGVALNLIMPMPQTVKQQLNLTIDDLLPIAQRYPKRFAVLGGGGSLNVMIQQAVLEGRVTAAMEKAFDEKAAELVAKGVVGFGEMTAEHFSMTKQHPYEAAPPDHPLFLRLADLAAEYRLPIDLHMEAVPEAMTIPSRFPSPPNPEQLQENIESFERLLAHNRQAKIIWVHLGWDNTEKRGIDLTRRLLAENPNLFMSIRIASGMRDRGVTKPTFPLDGSGRLRAEWLTLFQEFPDRFVIGSDEIIKPTNDHPSAGSIRSTIGLLEQLEPSLKRRIGYENSYRLYKINRNKLD